VSRIVVLGEVMVDVVARLAGELAPGSDAPAQISFLGGGSAANTAAWLAVAAPATPALVGCVGDDARGRAATGELRAGGVDARLVVDPERPTGTCIVLVAPDGERTMIPDPGANESLAADDLPEELLAPGGHLHVSGYSLLRAGSRTAALDAIARARAKGTGVSVDPSSAALLAPDFLELVRGIDLLLPNLEEAMALTAEDDADRAAGQLAGQVGEVVVKLGAGGALWTDGGEVVRVPGVPVDTVVDSTGAGDAFAAGLLAARLQGAGPEAAMTAGCRLAADAVGSPGGRPPLGRR